MSTETIAFSQQEQKAMGASADEHQGHRVRSRRKIVVDTTYLKCPEFGSLELSG